MWLIWYGTVYTGSACLAEKDMSMWTRLRIQYASNRQVRESTRDTDHLSLGESAYACLAVPSVRTISKIDRSDTFSYTSRAFDMESWTLITVLRPTSSELTFVRQGHGFSTTTWNLLGSRNVVKRTTSAPRLQYQILPWQADNQLLFVT